MVVRSHISFILMLIRLQFYCDWYGPLMVAMLCFLLAIDVALSALFFVL